MTSFFEDFRVGEEKKSSEKTILPAELDQFAALTGDPAPFHLTDGMPGALYEKRIAHGAFIFSVAIGLSAQIGQVRETLLALYRVDRLRFLAPVYSEDTIRVTKKVIETRDAGRGRGLVIFDSVVKNQHGNTVVVFQDQLLIRKTEA